MQRTLQPWLSISQPAPHAHFSKRIVTLFDENDVAKQCFAAHVEAVESIKAPDTFRAESDVLRLLGDVSTLGFVFASPPCTNLCQAGARWWKTKRRLNADFQTIALDSLRVLIHTLDGLQVPYAVLTPHSPLIRSAFRDHKTHQFHPFEYGGYLNAEPSNDSTLPTIPSRDAFTKRTLVFLRNTRMPWKRAVIPEFVTLTTKAGKRRRISPIFAHRKHKHLRHLAPRGFCHALAALLTS